MSLDASFFRHIEEALQGTSLVGTGAMDNPTDGELLDHARRAFKAIDRKRPNSPA